MIRDLTYWVDTARKETLRADRAEDERTEARKSLDYVVKETVRLHQRIEALEAALAIARLKDG